ncbi:hypothetical protein COY27_04575 [Candidatus Woesearchaeota archaeon CG_4_10_14_0_2_um_filter_33_13]|nr:MAG: hypothetical protein COY27_04575 [Candidatus Woesearchaeota archaeon CG_4_10_14_0_2_um_filter_33_13]
MTFKEQLQTVKKNWLILIIVLLILLVPIFSNNQFSSFSGFNSGGMYASDNFVAESAMMAKGVPSYISNEGFAPQVEDRKITKSSSLSSETKRGEFKDTESKLKSIVSAADGFLLNENVNLYGEGRTAYFYGNYQIKVATNKYDLVLSQLNELGKVTSFNENSVDITASYYNIKTELQAEQSRLDKYQEMYQEVKDISEKITLTDKIFDQERTVKYLQEAMQNKDLQVDYSTVYVTLTEEQSGYVGIAMVKFSELIRTIVNSFNNLLSLIFWALPWAILILVVWFGVKVVRKRK